MPLLYSVPDTLIPDGAQDDARSFMKTRTGSMTDASPQRSGTSGPEAVLQLHGVRKTYEGPGVGVTALDGVTLAIARGTFTAVMGPSGSGKTTLLQCAAGLDQPSEGTVVIDDVEVTDMSEAARTKFRRGRVGFIFQQFNLLPTLTVLQNVTLPMRLDGQRVDEQRCREMLDGVGLRDRVDHRPGELSGGQQQRAAIARALATRPSIIFADEPSGALDSRSATTVLELLREAVDEFTQTIVMVTHDPQAAAYADTVVFMRDGQLVDELAHPTADAVAERMTTLGDASDAAARRQGA